VACAAVNVQLNVLAPLDIGTLAQRSSPCSSNSGKTPPPLAILPSSTPASGKSPGPSTLCGSYTTPPQLKLTPSEQRTARLFGVSTYPCADALLLKVKESAIINSVPTNK